MLIYISNIIVAFTQPNMHFICGNWVHFIGSNLLVWPKSRPSTAQQPKYWPGQA